MNKLHPLTERLFWGKQRKKEITFDEYDKLIHQYLTERAEWLRKQGYEGVITPKMIDLAFQLEPVEEEKTCTCNLSGEETCEYHKPHTKPDLPKLPERITLQDLAFLEGKRPGADGIWPSTKADKEP